MKRPILLGTVAVFMAGRMIAEVNVPANGQSAANNSVTLDLRHPRAVLPVGKNSWDGVNPQGERITVTSQSLELNGKPLILV